VFGVFIPCMFSHVDFCPACTSVKILNDDKIGSTHVWYVYVYGYYIISL